MKNIITIILALAIGLGAGYFLFGGDKQQKNTSEHQHDQVYNTSGQEGEIWTCSMHLQIRQNEPGLCPLCAMDLVPLEEGSSDDPLVLQMTEEAVKLANIQTTTIGHASGSTGKTIRLSGKIQVDERLASSLVSHVSGRIEKLYVSFTGEQVNKGQKLAEIYSPDFLTAQRELLEALKLKDISPELLAAARKKMHHWKIAPAIITSIEEKGELQETFTLLAEGAGVITNKRKAVGDHLMDGEPLFEIIDLSKIWVLFDAYERDLPYISLGDEVMFTTTAVPGKTFKTKVSFIDPIIDSATRTAFVRAEVNNVNRALKPEMFVNGVLDENSRKQNSPLSVPKTAVLWTGKRSVVYVKMPDVTIPSYQFREVELGDNLGESYQILSGLDVGEEVVTNGSFTIDAAAQLNNQASMMNKNAQIKKVGLADELPDYTASTPFVFKQQLAKVSEAYMLLKDALVATDAEPAKNAAGELRKVLEAFDDTLLDGKPQIYWIDLLSAIKSHSENIADLLDVEAQRQQFEFLSEVFIKSIKVFGIADRVLYIQHCPMASNNNGANWVSNEAEIRNPYFGDKMMRCGLVQDTIGGE